MDDKDAELVALAEGYPYDLREEAFTFRGGEAHPFDTGLLADRTAVLAIGSNGAPKRLLAKFGADEVVPVLPARLADHAVVYAATVAGYGSVPATLVEAPGAEALVAVTFLTTAQLERMHASEALGEHYELVETTRATSIDVVAYDGPVVAYRSLFGPLLVNGQPLRLAEVPTVGTRFGAAYQAGLLALLHLRFGHSGEAYTAFVRDLVVSADRRQRVARSLASGLTTPGRPPLQKPAPGLAR